MKKRLIVNASAITLSLFILTATGDGQMTKVRKGLANVPEGELIEEITRLASPARTNVKLRMHLEVREEENRELLALVDELLGRFPESSFRDQATILKLAALADLARTRPSYLGPFIALTTEIENRGPQGELASENAFYALQAFLLGARFEKMPEGRRLRGTMERYQAFLEDYPKSKRRAVMWASLVRNAIALKQIDRAKAELGKLNREFPDHRATRRATGEVRRATLVGRPFALEYSAENETILDTSDYLGKVLLVHFWATWSEESTEGLAEFIELHRKYSHKGVQLIGVNVDKYSKRTAAALEKYDLPWPQYFDAKGLENTILVDTGVVDVPTIFVIDRRGICRSTDPGDKLTELVEQLLEKPAEPK